MLSSAAPPRGRQWLQEACTILGAYRSGQADLDLEETVLQQWPSGHGSAPTESIDASSA